MQHNSEATFQRMDDGLQNKGVVFTDLHTALREHEDLIQEKLFGLVPEDYDKFSALSAALEPRCRRGKSSSRSNTQCCPCCVNSS